jgi:L-alanine-DL-glutamate epimerase-like enolase superfamily enzyme
MTHIVDLKVERFGYRSKVVPDAEGHAHPGPEHDAVQTLLRVVSSEGIEGHSLGGDPAVLEGLVKPLLVGEDPWYRERIGQKLRQRQRLHMGTLNDRVLAAVDLALWDLAGKAANLPVYKLLGGYRDRVPAYASTMCGDDLEGGLDTPQAYADFALRCVERGYTAFKLHTWQPPVPGAPDPRRDVAACAAVREAVGDEMALMLDPYHYYSRGEAAYLGRELEKLGFLWLEEPMDEHSISSYAWLADQLSIPLVGPETAEGRLQTRAEWIVRGASDISRGGVYDVGGISPLMKIVGLCEAFGLDMEVHGGGAGSLHVLCAMGIPGAYYERGLLHPFLDYERPAPWLKQIVDPMDGEGYVHVSQQPGLGLDLDWAYIEAHRVAGGRVDLRG